jgi:prepilin signal peptidase PulO-like enzyme (type II secretory pathway)
MNEVFIVISLAIFGAALGSFAGAQVWRLRARQLVEDKKAGEKVDKKEYARLLPLTKQPALRDRSIDLDTGKPLAWYDMIPIVSWLMLRGKSRYSGKPIGSFELLMEIGMALFFVMSFIWWPHPLTDWVQVTKFGIWLVAGVVLAVQFATDYKWSILWTLLSYVVIGLGVMSAVVTVVGAVDVGAALWSAVGSTLILGGLYFVLYAVSRERWVGFGDVLLGIGLGLLLADWMLALVALFMANLIGTVVVMVGFAAKKLKRGQHVPFGPFFITGAVVAQLFGSAVVQWYLSSVLG